MPRKAMIGLGGGLALAIAAGNAAVRAGGAPAGPTFSPRPCASRGLTELGARCGVVAVPEDPAVPGGRTVALNVVIAPALQKNPGVPPLFHLEGGPGVVATNAAEFYLGPGRQYRRSGDVVLFDQRGTGGSNPLRCPAIEQRSPLEDEYIVSDVLACRDSLTAKASLADYSTSRAAEDIESVRRALGYEKINLWALSYGTRLAQEYMKRFPDRVRRGVMVGFVPLDYRAPLFHAMNAQRDLDLLFYKCQADELCGRKYPHLRSEWAGVLQTLERSPVEVRSGGTTFTIRRGPFAEAIRTSLGSAAGERELPAIIHQAAGGDFSEFLRHIPRDRSHFAEGLYLTIACSEGASRIRADDLGRWTSGTFLGDYRVRNELAACATWPTYPTPAEFYEAPTMSPPLLVLSGEMDNVVAPDWAYRFCSGLPDCRYVAIPDFGHGPFDLDAWSDGGCFDTIAATFLDRGVVDVSCLKRMRPPGFE